MSQGTVTGTVLLTPPAKSQRCQALVDILKGPLGLKTERPFRFIGKGELEISLRVKL